MYIYADAIGWIVIAYYVFVLALVAFALYKPKKWWAKGLAATLVLAIFIGPIAYRGMEDRARTAKAREKYEAAETLFRERCKTAGEKIYRTDKDVEGVLLMKIRPDRINYGQQFELDDPYGRDLGGDAYIRSFLRGRDEPRNESPFRYGYQFVDATDSKDGIRYRYTGKTRVVGRKNPEAHNVKLELQRNPNYDLNIYEFGFEKIPAPVAQPRYGVTYDDISTIQDRQHWIAGSSLRVLDLETGLVVAERIGYMMDPAQGSTAAGRSPWLLAAEHACPDFRTRFTRVLVRVPASNAQANQTYDFVEKVLQPNRKP